MRDNKLHTPTGVRDLLQEECAMKKEINRRVLDIFSCYGYREVESPMFEYIEVFSNEKRGSTDPRQMYQFFDRDGSTLALRSDMTPPIARIAATAYMDEKGPLRFSYFGNVFKYNESYRGRLREFSQAGVELLGVNTVEADAEVISVAVNSLLATGLSDFKITIGQVEFFKAVLEETGLDEHQRIELQEKIAVRDYVAAEELILKSGMPENMRELFTELPKLVGSLNVLAYAKRLTKSREAKRAVSQLQELYQILKCYHIEDYITFDLGMVNKLNYYTGIIFRGYTYGTGYTIVDGGRYDNFVEQYGLKTPAVGFGLKLSEVMSALVAQKIEVPVKMAKTLFAFSEAGRAAAMDMASKYRKNGMYIENSLLGASLEENIAYATKKQMSHVLYFMDDINLKLVSLLDEMGGFTVDVTVDELILPDEEEVK